MNNDDFSENRQIFINSESGIVIPVQYVLTSEGVTLLQCFEPEALFGYLDIDSTISFNAGCYMRGAVIPGEGAFFDLFDAFGSVSRNIAHLNEKQSRELILSRI